ncbi:MAG: cytochrome ubiquinol oxidase subunit I [Desulfitobacteriaceae bacterium]
MDAMTLSRIQFALTAGFHFIYVPLTIGLSVLIALIEYRRHRTGDKVYDQMARFWTRLLAINFAIGVATGITMEFQFGTNWANYSRFVGDIFGAPLAAEGIFAFFLESTFIGLLLFGRDRISSFMRFFSAAMVALGTNLSGFWILAANSWQQTPAGYKLEGGRAIMTDFAAALFNHSTLPRFAHTITAAYILAAFFMLAISAYYILKNKNLEIAKPSMKLALVFGLIFGLAQMFIGDWHAKQVAETQPVKLAAFEANWNTRTQAPMLLFAIPDEKTETNKVEIGIPGLLSFLAHNDVNAPVMGLKDVPKSERPPLLATFIPFHIMVGLGMLFALVLLLGLYYWRKGTLFTNRFMLKVFIWVLPLVYLAIELGWMATEVGRQPWIVQGLLKTANAASAVPAGQILLTTIFFAIYYAFLFALFLYLMLQAIRRGATQTVNSSLSGDSRARPSSTRAGAS